MSSNQRTGNNPSKLHANAARGAILRESCLRGRRELAGNDPSSHQLPGLFAPSAAVLEFRQQQRRRRRRRRRRAIMRRQEEEDEDEEMAAAMAAVAGAVTFAQSMIHRNQQKMRQNNAPTGATTRTASPVGPGTGNGTGGTKRPNTTARASEPTTDDIRKAMGIKRKD